MFDLVNLRNIFNEEGIKVLFTKIMRSNLVNHANTQSDLSERVEESFEGLFRSCLSFIGYFMSNIHPDIKKFSLEEDKKKYPAFYDAETQKLKELDKVLVSQIDNLFTFELRNRTVEDVKLLVMGIDPGLWQMVSESDFLADIKEKYKSILSDTNAQMSIIGEKTALISESFNANSIYEWIMVLSEVIPKINFGLIWNMIGGFPDIYEIRKEVYIGLVKKYCKDVDIDELLKQK
ncbi:MAG: hypothetical protein ACOCQD_02760 [archaeon]